MRRALEAAARVGGRTSPNPWVGAVVVAPAGAGGVCPRVRGCHRPSRRAPRRGDRAGRAGRTGPGRHPVRDPRAVRPPRSHAAVCGRRHRRPGSGGWSWPSGSRPAGRRPRHRRAARRRVTWRWERVPPPWPNSWRRTSSTDGPAEPWVVLKLAATLDGRTPPPTAPAGGSPARRPASTPTGCGPVRRRAGGGGHRAGRRPGSDRAAAARRPTVPRSGRTAAAGGARPRARRGRGRPRPRARRRPGEVLDELGRRGVIQVLVGAGPRWPTTSTAPVWSTATCSIWPGPVGGDDAAPLFAGPAAPTMADLWRGECTR